MRYGSLLFILCFFWIAEVAEAKIPRKTYPCCIYHLELPDLSQGEVAYINGMNHRPERAIRCGRTISNLGGDFNVYVVYNPTHGFWGDLTKCFFELFQFKVTAPVKKLHEKWNYFFENAPSDAICLQFCHSQGAIQVRNALLCYPPELRKRIDIVAIAPAAYISEDICHRIYHYVSRRDIVPKIDRSGKKRCENTIVVLTPHPKAAFFDHHFLSPTFRPAIAHHLKQYVNTQGTIFYD